MTILTILLLAGLVANAWIAERNYRLACENRALLHEYLTEKYGPDWRAQLDAVGREEHA